MVPENFVQDLVAGLDLSPDLVKPFVRNMTVRTRRPDARPILEVNGLLKLLVRIVPHFVAGDAKRLGVCQLQAPVEAAPEQDAANAPYNEQCRKRKARTGTREKQSRSV